MLLRLIEDGKPEISTKIRKFLNLCIICTGRWLWLLHILQQPPVQELHLLRGVEPVLAAGHNLERGAGAAREIRDRLQ